MESNTRTAGRAPGLRALGIARPLEVRLNTRGEPAGITRRGRAINVEQVEDAWRIVEDWWREERLVRNYYQLLLEDGRLLTCFHDESTGDWYEQRY